MASFDAGKRVDCRFYEEPYPEIESLVMVNVRAVGRRAFWGRPELPSGFYVLSCARFL